MLPGAPGMLPACGAKPGTATPAAAAAAAAATAGSAPFWTDSWYCLRENSSRRRASACDFCTKGTVTALFDAPPAVSMLTVQTPNTRCRSDAR